MALAQQFAHTLAESYRNPSRVDQLELMLQNDTYRIRHYAYHDRTTFESMISFHDQSYGVLVGDYHGDPHEHEVTYFHTDPGAAPLLAGEHADPRTMRQLQAWQSRAELVYNRDTLGPATVTAAALAVMHWRMDHAKSPLVPDFVDTAIELLLQDDKLLRVANRLAVQHRTNAPPSDAFWSEACAVAERLLSDSFPEPKAAIMRAAATAYPAPAPVA